MPASSKNSKKTAKRKTASSRNSSKKTTTKPRKRASARTQKSAPAQLYHPQYYTHSQPYPQQYQQRQYAPPQHYVQHSYQHYPNYHYIHPLYEYSAYGGLVGMLKGNKGATRATGPVHIGTSTDGILNNRLFVSTSSPLLRDGNPPADHGDRILRARASRWNSGTTTGTETNP